mmetsp:Transcript_31339/g.54395  ORF Transcript_31339/g.54395 Transcript_31339/m.54395 type:complete len:529 (-) Transcript_31339:259-1845(-)
MSIFEQADRQLSNKNKFWLPASTIPLQETHLTEGMLRLPSSSAWVVKYFVLTPTALYCCSKTSKRARGFVPIEWKAFEPFSECDSDQELFGFRLGKEGNSQDFYVDTADELDMWINCFRKTSILSGVNDDYEIGDKIGEGNYAVVYRATDNESGNVAAIKCISKEKLSRSSQGPKILVNEIHCMRSLDHPNILRIERVYEEDDKIYLVLEYIEGGDLFAKIIAAEKFSERYSAVLARKMLVALAYMHERNIIHRDLKLENIMMTSMEEESDIKIADFGFSAEMTTDNMAVFCGSPGYVAPEILNKQPYDAKADVYSAGIILYIILSGNSPFFGRNVEETLAKNREGRIRFDVSYWADITDDARDFIGYLTGKISATRPTAAEALKHRWIQSHNQHYFESLDSTLRRPSFSKRRTTEVSSIPNIYERSPNMQKKTTFPMIKNDPRMASPRAVRPFLTPVSRNLEPLVAPISIKPDPFSAKLPPGMSTSNPHSPSSPTSPLPLTEARSPVSAGSKGGKRVITWKQIRPHP